MNRLRKTFRPLTDMWQRYDRLIVDRLSVPRGALGRPDIAVMLGLALLGAAAYLLLIGNWGDRAFQLSVGGRWFQSDGWRVFDDMTDFGANHFRDSVHPLFSLISISATTIIKAVTPARDAGAIHIFNGLVFVAWLSLLYATIRLIGGRVLDGLVLAFFAATMAGSLFWFIVPETYVLGSLSIVLCFFVVALAPRRDWPFVAVAAASLSFTVTNWVAGLAAIVTSRSLFRGGVLALLSLLVVVAGWGVGKAVFPQPGSLFLLPGAALGEAEYVGHRDAGGAIHKLAGIAVGPVVAPALGRSSEQPTGHLLSFQQSAVSSWTSGEPLFVISAASWLLVLAYSLLVLARRRDRFSLTLALVLAGQALLHMVYGDETFLYSLHFVPLFVFLVAIALVHGRRAVLLPIIGCLSLVTAANNVSRLHSVVSEPIIGDDARLSRLQR